MLIKEGLKLLNLGSSVAEYDNQLEDHFLETQTYNDVINNRCDIISGDKGSGKTSIFKILSNQHGKHPELNNVEIIPAFNIQGSPIFQKITRYGILSEGQYSTVWKSYFISLVGNWILGIYDGQYTDKMFELNDMLVATGLKSSNDSPESIFSLITQLIRKILSPKSAECKFTFSETGIPVVIPKVELGPANRASKIIDEIEDHLEIEHESAFNLLNVVLGEVEVIAWIALDRLDEAFTGFSDHEIPALRALLRTYLDLAPYFNIKLKIFIRNDLFRKFTTKGFVNLTHINARKKDIVWDDEDLLSLLSKRIRSNSDFLKTFNISPDSADEDLFYFLFPQQVDAGERKPKTLTWIMSRIRDGNDRKSPRNLIDLVQKTLEYQSRREERSPREFQQPINILEPDSIKGGLQRLSSQRVTDTLMAEAVNLQRYLEMFKHQKAEHNMDSLSGLLKLDQHELDAVVQELVEIGFLERLTTGTYKIPMLYRDGLGIIQGKSF